jgi:hypothetical protein
MCCSGQQAHLLTVETRRGLFRIAPHAVDVTTTAGTYEACFTPANAKVALAMTLWEGLQRRLVDIEVLATAAARSPATARTTGRTCSSWTVRYAAGSTYRGPSVSSRVTGQRTHRRYCMRWSPA